jgi:hypothetical protein
MNTPDTLCHLQILKLLIGVGMRVEAPSMDGRGLRIIQYFEMQVPHTAVNYTAHCNAMKLLLGAQMVVAVLAHRGRAA